MKVRLPATCLPCLLILLSGVPAARGGEPEAIKPKEVIRFFHRDKLNGVYTWLQRSKYDDPDKVLTIQDGVVHFTGDENGYICTKNRYKDYHLVLEYRWGERSYGERKTLARSSGVFLHGDGPDGAYNGQFMAGLECQIIEGGTGDFELIPGKRADGSRIPVAITVEAAEHRDYAGQPVWKRGGKRVSLSDQNGYRVSWFNHDPQWENVLGYQPTNDLASPGKEWTRVDILCDGGHVGYYVNGVLANEAFDVTPSSGKISVQCEGAEMDFRKFELHPLDETTDLRER
jgi:hypothetical protein